MSSAKFARLSGTALFVGGLLAAGGFLLFAVLDPNHENYASPLWWPLNLMGVIGALLMAFGLLGLQARQARQAGKLGLIGTGMLFLGLLGSGVVGETIYAFVAPSLVAGNDPSPALIPFFLSSFLLMVGGILLGIAVVRARVLPRGAGVTVAAGALLNLVGNTVVDSNLLGNGSAVLIQLGLAWLGYALLSKPEAERPTTTAAAAEARG